MEDDRLLQPLVLIVEDEPFVRMLGADVLQGAGFAVIEAANAEEALHVLRARSDVVAVFTDIEMPGPLDGVDLAWRIRDQWPAVSVVVTSGRLVTPGTIPDEDGFIAKPYAPSTLVTEIADAIGRRG